MSPLLRSKCIDVSLPTFVKLFFCPYYSVINGFLSWCRHVLFEVTSLHPPSFQRNANQSVGRRSYVGMTQVKSHVIRVKMPKNSAITHTQASKTNPKPLTGQYPAIHMPKSVVYASSALLENTYTHTSVRNNIIFIGASSQT